MCISALAYIYDIQYTQSLPYRKPTPVDLRSPLLPTPVLVVRDLVFQSMPALLLISMPLRDISGPCTSALSFPTPSTRRSGYQSFS